MFNMSAELQSLAAVVSATGTEKEGILPWSTIMSLPGNGRTPLLIILGFEFKQDVRNSSLGSG